MGCFGKLRERLELCFYFLLDFHFFLLRHMHLTQLIMQWVVQGAVNVDIGANPSAEGGDEDEGVDDQAVKVVDIVDTFRLQVSFSNKCFSFCCIIFCNEIIFHFLNSYIYISYFDC